MWNFSWIDIVVAAKSFDRKITDQYINIKTRFRWSYFGKLKFCTGSHAYVARILITKFDNGTL